MAKRGRKGYAEELRIKENLAEIAPLMFDFVKKVLKEGTDKEKMEITTKILPKMIPQQMNLGTADGMPFKLVICKETAQQNDIDERSGTDSPG